MFEWRLLIHLNWLGTTGQSCPSPVTSCGPAYQLTVVTISKCEKYWIKNQFARKIWEDEFNVQYSLLLNILKFLSHWSLRPISTYFVKSNTDDHNSKPSWLNIKIRRHAFDHLNFFITSQTFYSLLNLNCF